MKDWQTIIAEIRKTHLTYSKVINTEKLGQDRMVAIHVDVSPILKDKVQEVLQRICGQDYSFNWVGNENNYFEIKKK